jgi:hypothetical protein
LGWFWAFPWSPPSCRFLCLCPAETFRRRRADRALGGRGTWYGDDRGYRFLAREKLCINPSTPTSGWQSYSAFLACNATNLHWLVARWSVAKAFKAPLLSGADPNANSDDLIKQVRERTVRYGAVAHILGGLVEGGVGRSQLDTTESGDGAAFPLNRRPLITLICQENVKGLGALS